MRKEVQYSIKRIEQRLVESFTIPWGNAIGPAVEAIAKTLASAEKYDSLVVTIFAWEEEEERNVGDDGGAGHASRDNGG